MLFASTNETCAIQTPAAKRLIPTRGATLDGSRGFQPTEGDSQRNVVAERQLKH
jgi:hypothetical protein